MRTYRMPTLRTLLVVVATACSVTTSAVGKRIPPKPVTPVVSNGIQYSADGDGRNQYVVATDTGNGNVLWRVKVFHNRIEPSLEEDVQWVFITDLKVAGSSLLVKDEKDRCYSVNLKTEKIAKQTCGEFAGEQKDAVPN